MSCSIVNILFDKELGYVKPRNYKECQHESQVCP